MFPHVMDLLFEKLKEGDGTERCNALFCFRMALEKGTAGLNYDELAVEVLKMRKDGMEAVREEAENLLEVLRKEDLWEGSI